MENLEEIKEDLLKRGITLMDDTDEVSGFIQVLDNRSETVYLKPAYELFQEIMANRPPKANSLDKIKRKTKRYF